MKSPHRANAAHRIRHFPAGSRRCWLSSHAVTIAALCAACGQRAPDAEPPPISGEPGTSSFEVRPASAESAPEPLEDEADLRRGYGVVDMRFEPCVKPQGAEALEGKDCPSGFLVYGPYVDVPAQSEIEVSFEVLPTRRVELYADIVSQMGKQMLAGLNPQVVEAGVNQRIGYKVAVFKADSKVESRIGMRAAEPARFTVQNFTMTVR